MPEDDLDPGHAEWLERLFATQNFMQLLGVEVVSFGHGRCELAVPCRAELAQQSGVMHAGVVAALADNAAGGAASTLMPARTAAVTVEYKISFVAPARGERLVARAEVLHSGGTLSLCESRVYAETDGVEHLCATALVTLWPLASGAA